MSIIGNRPLPLYEAELLTTDEWATRFLGPAGITGLWQVQERKKKASMSAKERKQLDNQYALLATNNKSLISADLHILMRTAAAILQKEN